MPGIFGGYPSNRIGPHLLQISRCVYYHVPNFRPRSVQPVYGLRQLCSSTSTSVDGVLKPCPSEMDIRVQRCYSTKGNKVFSLTDNVDMLRKRISFTGSRSDNTKQQILPVGLITPEPEDGKQLKIVIVPLDLSTMDATSLKETLETINKLRLYANHIEAFSNTMVEEYNTLSDSMQEVEDSNAQLAKEKDAMERQLGKEDRRFWEDMNSSTNVNAVGQQSMGLGQSTPQEEQPLEQQQVQGAAVNSCMASLQQAAPTASSSNSASAKPMSTVVQPKTTTDCPAEPAPIQSTAIVPQVQSSNEEGFVEEVCVDVPEELSDRLNDLAVSSMELSFEMDLTNVKDALENPGAVEDHRREPMMCMHTKVELDEPESIVQSLPLKFQAKICGVVELDADKLDLDLINDQTIPYFNDDLTSLAANLCSTALEKGFSTTTPRSRSASGACSGKGSGSKPFIGDLKLNKDEKVAKKPGFLDTTHLNPRAQVAHLAEAYTNAASPEAKDGCKHPPVKPKRKCPGKCPLITDPCKEDPCKRPSKGKKQPNRKASSCVQIVAQAGKSPCGKGKGKGKGKGSKKKKDPCAKFKKSGKGGKKDPCAKKKKKKNPCGKSKKKKNPCGKNKKKKNPCGKNKKKKKNPCAKKGGSKKKKDPCAKFKKGGKKGGSKCKKFSTLSTPEDVGKRHLSTKPHRGPRFLVYSTLVRRHYRTPAVRSASHQSNAPLPCQCSMCLKQNRKPDGLDTIPARFIINSKLLRHRYEGLVSELMGRRSYSKKGKGKKGKKVDGKCMGLGTKYPKNRKKNIKARTGLRSDCFPVGECPPKLPIGKCDKVKFPRKKCDRSKGKKKSTSPKNGQYKHHPFLPELRQQRSLSTNPCCKVDPDPLLDGKAYSLRIPKPYRINMVPACVPTPNDFDVVIRTGSVALSGSDIHVYERGNSVIDAITLGHDATGFVEEVGRCVKHLRPGDRVVMESALSCGICELCKRGQYNLCSSLVYNGFLSSYQTHPADLCHRLDQSITMEEGSLVPTLALGCQACLTANIAPTSNVLVLGASPMGVSAGICAGAIGAKRVILGGRSGPALDAVTQQFGIETVPIDESHLMAEVLENVYCKFQDWPDRIINGSVSSLTMNLAVMALRPCGICVLAECDSECVSFNALDVLMKNIRMLPSFRCANMYSTALQLMRSGQAPMHRFITGTFPMSHAEAAFRLAQEESNQGLGKVIVNCADETEL
ncbi:hypothetical protein KR018_001553, partial [Drosophila ironensis]